MDKTRMIDKLNDLIQLDHDAVGAYKSAIDRIDVESIRARLREFQADHERHIVDLSALVTGLGGKPKDRPDMKGAVLKGFTAMTSMMGTEAALRAMQGNEKLTNSSYASALREGFTEEIRTVLEANYRDEQRHLAYIEDALQNRIWEGAGASHP